MSRMGRVDKGYLHGATECEVCVVSSSPHVQDGTSFHHPERNFINNIIINRSIVKNIIVPGNDRYCKGVAFGQLQT